MENASKALIIAGAILLAILIISLGLVVYNQAKNTIGNINLSQQEKEAFNSKFSSYQGDKVAGAQVNSLFQTVISSNQAESDANTGAIVSTVSVDGTKIIDSGAVVSGKATYVTTGKTYKVLLGYSNGIVNSITITTNS